MSHEWHYKNTSIRKCKVLEALQNQECCIPDLVIWGRWSLKLHVWVSLGLDRWCKYKYKVDCLWLGSSSAEMPWESGQGKPQEPTLCHGSSQGLQQTAGQELQATHLLWSTCEERRKELSLFSLDKGQFWGTQQQPDCASEDVSKNMGCLLWCLTRGWDTRCASWNKRGLAWMHLEERLCRLYPLGFPRFTCIKPWATWSDTIVDPALSLLMSLLTWIILWSYNPTNSNWITGNQCFVCLFAVKTPNFLNHSQKP